jgi:hypothetical protein
MSARQNWNPWAIALVALVLSGLLLAFGRGHASGVAESMSFAITVVPADSVNLDCSSDQRFGDVHCGYDSQGRPAPGGKPLRPYVTVGRELVLLSGVFEEPRVNTWLTRARAVGSNERVTLDCKASLLGKLPQIAVRWQIGAAWGKEHDVPVAKIQSCAVSHQP